MNILLNAYSPDAYSDPWVANNKHDLVSIPSAESFKEVLKISEAVEAVTLYINEPLTVVIYTTSGFLNVGRVYKYLEKTNHDESFMFRSFERLTRSEIMTTNPELVECFEKGGK